MGGYALEQAQTQGERRLVKPDWSIVSWPAARTACAAQDRFIVDDPPQVTMGIRRYRELFGVTSLIGRMAYPGFHMSTSDLQCACPARTLPHLSVMRNNCRGGP